MAIAHSAARDRALALIQAGLESNAIKLYGPRENSSAAAGAKDDVEYLSLLLSGLTEAIKKGGEE